MILTAIIIAVVVELLLDPLLVVDDDCMTRNADSGNFVDKRRNTDR